MRAMILAAGLGTRLRPFTERLPKPLFPVLGERMLDRCIATVIKGMEPELIVVNASHLADQIEAHLNERSYGVEVVVSREEKILGTGGGIKQAEKWLTGDDFVVMNSDLLMQPDWEELMTQHRDRGAMATLLLRKNHTPKRYSLLRMEKNGEVTSFPGAEKGEGTGVDYMFCGVSILSPRIFDLIPEGRAVAISPEVYAPLVREGGSLYGVATDAAWNDIGTVADYHATVMQALDTDDITPATMWAELRAIRLTPPVYIETGAEVGAGARLGPNVAIHTGAKVGAGAELRNSVILPGSMVEVESKIEGKVI